MIKTGDVVEAIIVRIERYGIYFEYEGSSILVLGPDASPVSAVLLESLYEIGQNVEVVVGRFSEKDQVFRGFIHADGRSQ